MNYEVNPSRIKCSGSFLQTVGVISFSYVLNLFYSSLSKFYLIMLFHLHMFLVYSKQFLVCSQVLTVCSNSSCQQGAVDLNITDGLLQLLPSSFEHTQFFSLDHLHFYFWLIRFVFLRNCTRIRSMFPKLTSLNYHEFMSQTGASLRLIRTSFR